MRPLPEKQVSARVRPCGVRTIAAPGEWGNPQPKRPRNVVLHREHPTTVAVEHEPAGVDGIGIEACVDEQGGVDSVDTVFWDAEPDEFPFCERAAGRPNPAPPRPIIFRSNGFPENA